jgi:hypothetical protein
MCITCRPCRKPNRTAKPRPSSGTCASWKAHSRAALTGTVPLQFRAGTCFGILGTIARSRCQQYASAPVEQLQRYGQRACLRQQPCALLTNHAHTLRLVKGVRCCRTGNICSTAAAWRHRAAAKQGDLATTTRFHAHCPMRDVTRNACTCRGAHTMRCSWRCHPTSAWSCRTRSSASVPTWRSSDRCCTPWETIAVLPECRCPCQP